VSSPPPQTVGQKLPFGSQLAPPILLTPAVTDEPGRDRPSLLFPGFQSLSVSPRFPSQLHIGVSTRTRSFILGGPLVDSEPPYPSTTPLHPPSDYIMPPRWLYEMALRRCFVFHCDARPLLPDPDSIYSSPEDLLCLVLFSAPESSLILSALGQ